MGFEEPAMERNATACAMEWSIELEKGLRSKIPGKWESTSYYHRMNFLVGFLSEKFLNRELGTIQVDVLRQYYRLNQG